MNNQKAPVGLIATVGFMFVAILIALNSFTIVPVGEEAATSSFGNVHDEVITGFNVVAPWWTVDDYNLQHQTFTIDDLGVASQDKFKTNIDVAFTGNFVAGHAAQNRRDTGTEDKYLETHVYKRVLSCMTKAGGEVKDSQAFFDKAIQVTMGTSALACVNDYLIKDGGFVVNEIQFSDIRLDPVVKEFMVETKQRQEAENQATSNLAIADLDAQKVTKISAANLLASKDDMDAAKNASDAKFYDMKQEAAGNEELARSLSPALVKYVEAKRWDGVRSTHVLGTDTTFMLK